MPFPRVPDSPSIFPTEITTTFYFCRLCFHPLKNLNKIPTRFFRLTIVVFRSNFNFFFIIIILLLMLVMTQTTTLFW